MRRKRGKASRTGQGPRRKTEWGGRMPCGGFVVSLYDVPLQSNVPEAKAAWLPCATNGRFGADGTEDSAHWTKGLRSHADRILKNGKLRNHSIRTAGTGPNRPVPKSTAKQRLKVAQEHSDRCARSEAHRQATGLALGGEGSGV